MSINQRLPDLGRMSRRVPAGGVSYFNPQAPFESEGGSGPLADSGDPAFYDAANDKVWFTWEAADARLNKRYVCVRTYHIGTTTWSPIYVADTRTLVDDVHGTPSIAVVAGYAYIIFGYHNNNARLVCTTNANDPSAWTQLPDIGGQFTFVSYIADATKLYWFTQRPTVGSAPSGSAIQSAIQITVGTPSAASIVWGTGKTLLDGNDGLGVLNNYTTGGFLGILGSCESADGLEIYILFSFRHTIDLDPNNELFGIARYVKSTGGLKNWSGSRTIASGSLPAVLSDITTDFVVIPGVRLGSASIEVDAAGLTHVVWTDGATGNFDVSLYHMSGTPGGAWSSVRTVHRWPSAVTALGGFATVTRKGTDAIRVWTADAAAAASYSGYCAGNVIAYDRSAAGLWSKKKGIIRSEGPTYALDAPSRVRNGPSGARVFTTENAFNYLTIIGNLRGYAMGDAACLIAPTSIYDRWSPLEIPFMTVRADGLRGTATSPSTEAKCRSIHANTTGKKYFQIVSRRVSTITLDYVGLGLSSENFPMVAEPAFYEYLGRFQHSVGFSAKAGEVYKNDTLLGGHASLANNAAVTTFSFCIDIPNLKLWVKNDTRATAWNPDQGGADPATGVGGYSLAGWSGSKFFITASLEFNGDAVDILAGPAQAGTPPTGFSHWITTY